jgi:inosine-uridine nucleoside N-ribohydrolase
MLPLLLCLSFAATPVIIDTDMGSDDMMAIALLLAHRDLPIEAITVVNGMAHVPAGAANARRLIAASGRSGIPVYEGAQTPRNFPDEWRTTADRPISNLTVPATEKEHAGTWLAKRLQDTAHPVRILALGPLTNIAHAHPNPKAVEEIVIMGGALHVPGNLHGAEANFYADPASAQQVFEARIPIRLIPLDATNQVPIDAAFVTRFQTTAKGPLAAIVKILLNASQDDIAHGAFYAWDPLAAAAFLDSSVATWTPTRVTIAPTGRATAIAGPPNSQVALAAGRQLFTSLYQSAFR